MMRGAGIRKLPPALMLAVLAPAFGELLSGSAPPLEFFSPLILPFMVAFYGGGAILIRELALRWGGTSRSVRWAIVLLLGAAYGIVEEGLAAKSFFDPGWMDLGVLGRYGRWAGVNWLWSIDLTLFHTIVSIAAPIVITELVFRNRRDERWVGRRGTTAIATMFVALVALMFLALTPYRPPLITFAGAVGIVAGLVALARRAGRVPRSVSAAGIPKPGVVLAASFGASLLVWLASMFLLPVLEVSSLVPIGLTLAVAAAAERWLMHAVASVDWTDAHNLAFVSGALLFWALIAVFDELSGLAGMSLVAAATVLGLTRLRRRVRASA